MIKLDYFSESTNNDAINTYGKNKLFNNFIFSKEYYPYRYDGWYEKQNYGLVDNFGRAVFQKLPIWN